MSERTFFGTDGIRGVANTGPMSVETALRLGRAIGHLVHERRLGQRKPGVRGRVVIGKDTRLSGYILEQAIAAGVGSVGVDTIFVGPLPTPGIAFITQSMRADAGIVVSASHNPFTDNGIKIFGHDGFKLADDVESEIERLIKTDAIDHVRPIGTDVGRAKRIDDAAGRYIVYAKSVFPRDLTLDGIRVVVDCAHGAAYKVAPTVLGELGAEVIALGVEPNGTNINDGVGSLYPEIIERKVRETRADIGIALDGDADRVIIVDEKGDLVDGDAVMALCARELKRQGRLATQTVVATVMSNLGLERCLKPHGISVVRTQVGDRYVVEEMRKNGRNLGGEKSGHVVFLEHATTGDGVIAALVVLGVLVREKRPLSEIADLFVPTPQELLSVRVNKKTPLNELDDVRKLIGEVEARLGESGRVLVRYSGTEMKVRVMVEGDDAEAIRADAQRIAESLSRALA